MTGVLPLLEAVLASRGPIAAVGAGGKTGLLFALAAAAADQGRRVLLTTTTHIRDPRRESGRTYDEVVLDPRMAEPPVPGPLPQGLAAREGKTNRKGPGWIRILAADHREDEGRFVGIHPGWPRLAWPAWDLVLVEADGSRERPLKAPAAHEPALPEGVGLVLGLIGLEALGHPLDGQVAHRPELLGPIVGCASGEPLGYAHLKALVEAPEGLFKASPPGAARILVLNKADRLSPVALQALEEELRDSPPTGTGMVILSSLRVGFAKVVAG